MKNSNELQEEVESSQQPQKLAQKASMNLNTQINVKSKVQKNINEPIFMTQTEPAVQDSTSILKQQENQVKKYNQVSIGQPVQVKSYSQERTDRFLNKKQKYRSHNQQSPQKDLQALEYLDSNIIVECTAPTSKKNKQIHRSSGYRFTDRKKINIDLNDDHVSSFEWIVQLKSQQLQKNMNAMFLKNERKKLLQCQSKMAYQLAEQNIQSLCISPSMSNNIKIVDNIQINKPNEFDFIISQEKQLNQKTFQEVKDKIEQNCNSISTSPNVNGIDINIEDKMLAKINQQAQKMIQNKLQQTRFNKHTQGLQSPLSSIKKELQTYNEDFCLPYLQPFRGFNNKTKVYMLNKQKGKKIQRESSLSYNNGSKISQYTSPDVLISPKTNNKKNIDSSLNLITEYQQYQSPFIKEDKLRYHINNSSIHKDDMEQEELYTEHFKSPVSLQLYDHHKLEQERFKLTFRKKANTTQIGKVISGQSPSKKDLYSLDVTTQDGLNQNKVSPQQSTSNNKQSITSKQIRIKLKQYPLISDLNNIQHSIDKASQQESAQNNKQIILPHLNIKSYHNNNNNNNKYNNNCINISNSNLENIDIPETQPTSITNHMEETSGDFFHLQNYYKNKYNNDDKVPKQISQNRDILSCQNSISKYNRQLNNAQSILTEYDLLEDQFQQQKEKRRSNSFFSSPQKQKKNRQVQQIQNSLQITPFSCSNYVNQKKKKTNLMNDLQPWEDQQNFNETNFFQIVKERTDKTARNERKISFSELSQDEKQSGYSSKSSDYYQD
ncbi:hypothetical protein ABPG72_009616 [Tetrahymena utriculariae]